MPFCTLCGKKLNAGEADYSTGMCLCASCASKKMAEKFSSTPLYGVQRITKPTCDLCGIEIYGQVHIYNNQHLCEACFEKMPKDQIASPHPMNILIKKPKKKKKTFIFKKPESSLLTEILSILDRSENLFGLDNANKKKKSKQNEKPKPKNIKQKANISKFCIILLNLIEEVSNIYPDIIKQQNN